MKEYYDIATSAIEVIRQAVFHLRREDIPGTTALREELQKRAEELESQVIANLHLINGK